MNTHAWITAILAVALASSVVWNSMLESDLRRANDRIRAQDATIQRLSNEMLALESKGMMEVRQRLEKIEGLKTKIAEKKRELAGLDQVVARKSNAGVDRSARLRVQSEVEKQRAVVQDLARQLVIYQDQQKQPKLDARTVAELRQSTEWLMQRQDAETKRLGELEQRLAQLTFREKNESQLLATAQANRTKLDREILELERTLALQQQQQERASASIAE